MYKKITHTIVEEHFDHPMANEIKASMSCEPPVPPPTMPDTQSMVDLKLASRYLFGNFVNRVHSYIASAINGGNDLDAIADQLKKDVTALSQVINEYYGTIASIRFNEHVTSMVKSLGEIVKAIKSGKSITELKQRLTVDIKDIARLLDNVNMRFWPEDAVMGILTKVADEWIVQAESREKKDWTADAESVDKVNAIMIAGQPDGTMSFADIFSNGIIQQFPNKFKY